MNAGRVGRACRAIRLELGLRQVDVAGRAGVSQQAVSMFEAGRLDAMTLRTVRSILAAVEAEFVPQIWWRGGELDRVLDEGHARLVGRVVDLLGRLGWECRIEVSYSVYGERGSMDVLAWHEATRTLLVVEVKTSLTSVEETLRRHDQKARLASRIAAERFGWTPRSVGRLLVLPEAPTARRRVARHSHVLDSAYPLRGLAVRAWLRQPIGAVAGLVFLSATRQAGVTRGSDHRRRVRRAAKPASRA